MSRDLGVTRSALDRLADRYWQRALDNDYCLRAQIGLPIERIRPVTLESADEDAAFAESLLDGLAAIDLSALDHQRWLTHRTLSYLASKAIGSRTHFWLQQQVTPYGGWQVPYIASILRKFQFENDDDAAQYETLLHEYALFVGSIRAFVEGQHRRGIILPNAEIDATQAMYEGFARDEHNAQLVPGDDRIEALSPTRRSAFRSAAESTISNELEPALRSIAAYLAGPYRTGAPDGVGLSQYPGGDEYYRYLVMANTTLTVAPEELHAAGLEEVAKLNEQLDGIGREVQFDGDFSAFKTFLARDPQFYAATTQQFGERLEAYVERAAAVVGKYFLHMPKAPYAVEPLPRELAGPQTFGYYDHPTAARPRGAYLYNAWHPERTSLLSAGALICHELIPGHHFQIALQLENTALPNVRRYDFSEVGFCEGWGEYASQVGWEMGVYATPYDRAGRLMQDMMIAVRLVVDTAMNAMGWSRERAAQFMRENLTLSDEQIATESLRYSTDIPAQALAYKTGELTFLKVREHARERLGSEFDIRQFHSWALDSGSMTLDTLREHVDYEIAQRERDVTGRS
jgi:uncharacterized protein (DUF885 family)